MGRKNYLIDGVSCSGKTSLAIHLEALGHHVIHGDRELGYQGDPFTGERLPSSSAPKDPSFLHNHHIWDIKKVRSLARDPTHAMTFFCGGSRNHQRFIHLFDKVFVLDIDTSTLKKRLSHRPADEFGGTPLEKELILKLHANKQDTPKGGIHIDASQPLELVANQILARCNDSTS